MWFAKKKEESSLNQQNNPLPDLPDLPEVPQNPPNTFTIPAEKDFSPSKNKPVTLPALPAFPNSSTANRVSRDAIKSALAPSPPPTPPVLQTVSPKPYTQEIEEDMTKFIEPSGHFRIESSDSDRESDDSRQKEAEEEVSIPLPEPRIPIRKVERVSSTQPIFIRLDKFQNSAKNIHEIKRNVSEVESYLASIKEVRDKEGREILEWEHLISETKSKLENIEKTLFSTLD